LFQVFFLRGKERKKITGKSPGEKAPNLY
jgi:hypothetical protein